MYYEDFEPGRLIETAERTVTTEDVDRFVELSRLDNPIFLSDEAARRAGHPSRIVPGPLLLGMALGLAQKTGVFDHVVAVARFDRLRFLQPGLPGETIRLHARVARKEPASRPGRGTVVLDFELRGRGGRVLIDTQATYRMRCRESD